MVFIVHFLTLLLSLLSLIATCLSSPRHVSVFKPAYFLLAGDSTTATQSVGGGGWGNGFLDFTLREGSSGRNYGHNGATTKSFREGVDLDRLISEAKTKTADYTVYVTIQFGHNDQKSTSGVNLTQYSDNLVACAREVSSVGAIPILVTSLTRRKYTNITTPTIIQDLAVQRKLTLAAARKTHSRYIDLNIASTDYCNAIGPEAAWKYNLDPTDYTHLNGWGSVVFGRMVSDLMVRRFEDIAAVTERNRSLSRELWQGSAYGVNAMFSTLQSAAMGGYGVPAVAGAVQGAAAAGAGFAAHNLWGIISENKDD
ncbi:esterase [Aureobasidium sp. EXF-3400]|nr:esterase [Aureobasidium sp. EXF-12344]KAI4775838.1 esterase [Aureobasidium sp. EXF-3400]